MIGDLAIVLLSPVVAVWLLVSLFNLLVSR